MERADTIVVGLGGAGASAAFHLARRGRSVLGLERFGPTHEQGSSHGRSRIYRTAYFEGAAYVPLVQRAQVLWRELQSESRAPILRPTGGLVLGTPESPSVAGALRVAKACRLEHELLDAEEVGRRYPQFRLASGEVAVWDPNAGALFPENCVRAHADGARAAGAALRYDEPLVSWSASSDGVEVRTARALYRAAHLVLSVGAWTRETVTDLRLPLEIERQFMLWFPPTDPATARPERMPVFLWDRGPEEHTYGLPDFGDGVKLGTWSGRISTSPGAVDRTFTAAEAEPVRRFVAERLRGVRSTETDHTSCLYTNTPDHHFVLGRHPRHDRVVVVSACSGHGFKFTSVIGEVVDRLVGGEDPGFDLSLFDPGRFEDPAGQSPAGADGRSSR